MNEQETLFYICQYVMERANVSDSGSVSYSRGVNARTATTKHGLNEVHLQSLMEKKLIYYNVMGVVNLKTVWLPTKSGIQEYLNYLQGGSYECLEDVELEWEDLVF